MSAAETTVTSEFDHQHRAEPSLDRSDQEKQHTGLGSSLSLRVPAMLQQRSGAGGAAVQSRTLTLTWLTSAPGGPRP
ncbi:hypothetical protein ACOMHN_036570 [Nucella lapillus]